MLLNCHARNCAFCTKKSTKMAKGYRTCSTRESARFAIWRPGVRPPYSPPKKTPDFSKTGDFLFLHKIALKTQ